MSFEKRIKMLEDNISPFISDVKKRIEALEKKVDDRSQDGQRIIDEFEEQIAELKEQIKNRNIQIDNINDRKNEQQREINELKEDNEHLKKTIFDWLLYSSTNREVLRDSFQAIINAINKNTGIGLLASELEDILKKLDSKTEKKKCSECGAYLWSEYSPHNEGCSQFKEKPAEPEIPSDFKGTWKEDLMYMAEANKETEPEKQIGKTNAYYKGFEDCEKGLIEEFITRLESKEFMEGDDILEEIEYWKGRLKE